MLKISIIEHNRIRTEAVVSQKVGWGTVDYGLSNPTHILFLKFWYNCYTQY